MGGGSAPKIVSGSNLQVENSMLERSILTKGMRRWFFFIAVTSTFLVANGFYLWIFESRAVADDYLLSYYYIGNVLAHLVIGLLFGIPFVGFVISHLKVTWRHKNQRSRLIGIVLAIVAVLSLGTGVYLMIDGAVRDNYWILIVHIIVCLVGVLLFSLHRWASSRASRLTVANLKEVAIIVAAFVLLIGGHYAGKLFSSSAVQTAQAKSFLPSEARTADGNFIPSAQLTDVEYCRQCHADAYAQWKSSAHSHSSFTNVFYARSVENLQKTIDPNAARWCAGCHDQSILFSGDMQSITADRDFTKHPYAGASITCITCHSMQSADIRGNGNYVIAPPTQYPFATSDSPFLRYINRLLINVKPEPHRRAFLKPFHKTSEFCASCHKVSIPQEVNNYKWQRGQDEYDAWHNSGISWNNASSFYRPKQAFATCASCHMPTVPSSDRGSINGLVHFHSFPAANTALASVSNDTAWVARTTSFLKMNRLTLDIFAMKRGRDIYAPLDAPQAGIIPGENIQLDVVVRNRSVGHRFPGGTADAEQAWVELTGTDATGKEFFHSGAVDPRTQHVDSTAHFYHSRIFTKDGDLILTRAAQQWTATLYNNFVNPGAADVVHYRVDIPTGITGVTFNAKLHYKKFDERFTEFVYAGVYPPILPDVVMAEQSVTIKAVDSLAPADTYAAKTSDRERFNDYGIGLWLFQLNNRDASWAWQRVTQIDPTYADGWINRARLELKEGYLPEADVELTGAEKADPAYYKSKFFRAQYLKKSSRLDEAMALYKELHEAMPHDRQTIDEIGRIYYLLNDYPHAIEWYQKELDIDPEDMNPHYTMMQCYRAMGNVEKAEHHHAEYLKYKDDETQRERTQKYRNMHPADNNEAQPIHEHKNALVSPDIAAPKVGIKHGHALSRGVS